MNVSDLRKVLGMSDQSTRDVSTTINETTISCDKTAASVQTTTSSSSSRLIRVRRQSMEQLDLIKVNLLYLHKHLSSLLSGKTLIFFLRMHKKK